MDKFVESLRHAATSSNILRKKEETLRIKTTGARRRVKPCMTNPINANYLLN